MKFYSVRLSPQRLIKKSIHFKKLFTFALLLFCIFSLTKANKVFASPQSDKAIFVRFKIIEPAGKEFRVTIGGFRHSAPWYFPDLAADATGGEWSEWIDLSKWDWHGRFERAGGVAEWSSIKMVVRADSGESVAGCAVEVQLSDQPDEKNAVVKFTEKTASDSIAFLVPFPLRKNAAEFETASQMTARHAAWAKAATGGKPIALKKFNIITSLWNHYDPALELQEIKTLRSLGFNVLGNVKPSILQKEDLRNYQQIHLYDPDPAAVDAHWKSYADSLAAKTPAEKTVAQSSPATHWAISDEVSALDFRNAAPEKLDGWFRAYLKDEGVTAAEIGQPIEQVNYPANQMYEPFLPKTAALPQRRLLYYAAKFGQFWSAKQLRRISDRIRGTFPGMPTEALMPSHGFLGNAWGAANIGMSYRMLDIFELGKQQSVTQLSAEDWLGLNHMYSANYTWSGGQTFGYYNAILRSAMIGKPLELRGLITPSDDGYLRLKAYSSLGQGAKSLFFWTFGPTYIGTENYWSDLRSEYDGIAKLNRSLAKAEDVLYPAKTVSDPAAILYSVSHDIWNTDNQAPFVEKRLLWHALRHLQIQPDFLREEDVAAGKLDKYKVLYITDWCVSRKASAAIDRWVKQGGTLYLSAGAATRDEFYEPFQPPFAEKIWSKDAAQTIVSDHHAYNERTDLPTIAPLTTAKINLPNQSFDLPVIGSRAEMRPNEKPLATFADGKTAGVTITYGRGQIIAVGFSPMLAYGQSANFKPTTLEEKWQPEARSIIKFVLDQAKVSPIAAANMPVVETNFLNGANGAAIVLANYTYRPISSLTIDLKTSQPFKQAVSVEGGRIEIKHLKDGVRLTLPLKLTDIILLKK